MELFEIVVNIESYKVYLLYMENAFINFDVYYILHSMRLKFREWVDKTNSYNIPGTACRLSLKRFRDLTRAYVSVCVAVKGLNDTRGGIMFTLFSANSLLFTMHLFSFIDFLPLTSGRSYHTAVVCVQMLWCVYHFSMAVLFIEPWHRISSEVNEIGVLLTKLNFNVTPVGKRIPLELDLMFKQLLLNQPTMSPLDLVTIQRSLHTATISFITTYFVIMVQSVQNS
ncbi:gustatory receptor for sugar taste 43a-like [Vanessa cardui]|uniref:gustatory receptor for sugar taste 43a-like n=1 Tax=Vanessa cardui TaxID=171605 RepID=UPI001F12CA0B|nr:gustatory receptor for sugar taste 43a-like [Vanessa cardui]